jgi:hypothetical protein
MKLKHLCVLAALVLCGVTATCAQQPTNLDTAAWETINKKIVDIYKGLDASASPVLEIHLMTVPKALPVGDADAFKAAYLDIADTIPKWSPTWTPSDRFSDEYLLFAESLAVPHRADVTQADYDAASKAYEKATNDKTAAYRLVLKEWSEYQTAQTKNHQPIMNWNSWLNNVSKTGAAYKKLEAARLNAQGKMYNLYDSGVRVIGGFKERIINYNFDPTADMVENTPRYPYNYASATNAIQQIAKDAAANQNAGTPMFSWDGSKDTLTRSEERSSWGASASYTPFLGIFQASASASGSHYSLDQSQGGASVSIKAFGFGRVSILPGAWYAPSLVPWFKNNNGQFLPNAPISPDKLWGETGQFNLRPVEMIVMVKPTLTAKLSKSDYKRVVDTLNAGGGVSFGPFSFGGNYSKTTETITKNDEKGEITFTNSSDTPYIIAVISQKL